MKGRGHRIKDSLANDSLAKDPLIAKIGELEPQESAKTEKTTPGPAGVISFERHVDPLAFLEHLAEKYGDVVRYQTRFGSCFLFLNPRHVQTILHDDNYRRTALIKTMLGDGLLASDGPIWKSQRRLMQQDFMPDIIAPFAEVMTSETQRTVSEWSVAAQRAQIVDVTMEMTRLTLRIVARSLFGETLSDQHSAELCTAITQTITDLGNISCTAFGVPAQFTPGRNASFNAGKQVIDATCHDMIARRRDLLPANRPRDLLTLLIEAETKTGPMNDRLVRDQIVTMLVGGHETTALTLAWAWNAIAENPHVEEKLHAEVDAVLAGRQPELVDFPRLLYTQAVFQEALRLYPPVWFMARVANRAGVIDDHVIPAGACVLISPYFTHRHKNFWDQPLAFNPARFMEPAAKDRHRYAYFPFGGGRHQCLGIHFGLMEGTIILADLAQRFCVKPVKGREIRPAPGITLRQSPGLLARLEARQPQTARSRGASEAV